MRHFYCAWDQAFANSGFALLEWNTETRKLEYRESHVFHPSVLWGHKSDAIAFLEHQRHIKETLSRIQGLGELHAIGIEGVAFSAPGQAASRGGIWAIYSTMSMFYGDVVVLAPTSMKKYMTGYGFAEKEDIKAELDKRYPIADLGLAEDAYDALGLAEMAAYAYMIRQGLGALVKPLMSPEQYLLFTSTRRLVKKVKKRVSKKPAKRPKKVEPKPEKLAGICYRTDELYLEKRSSE